MKVALLDADVNLRVANTIIDNVKNRAVGMKVITGVSPGQQFVKLLYDELVLIMGSEKQSLVHRDDGKPTVVMLAGLQVQSTLSNGALFRAETNAGCWQNNIGC
jgi:signal recognition particle subunit SRP54